MSTEKSERVEWKHFDWLLECELCGDGAEVRIKNGETEWFYDGQAARCCDDDCPATGSIVAGPETPAYVDWHDMIFENGEFIPNPEWEEYEANVLMRG